VLVVGKVGGLEVVVGAADVVRTTATFAVVGVIVGRTVVRFPGSSLSKDSLVSFLLDQTMTFLKKEVKYFVKCEL
jgi:hypothetical protein